MEIRSSLTWINSMIDDRPGRQGSATILSLPLWLSFLSWCHSPKTFYVTPPRWQPMAPGTTTFQWYWIENTSKFLFLYNQGTTLRWLQRGWCLGPSPSHCLGSNGCVTLTFWELEEMLFWHVKHPRPQHMIKEDFAGSKAVWMKKNTLAFDDICSWSCSFVSPFPKRDTDFCF
jgi:hypothetical protein